MGVTGSIGRQTLEVLRTAPEEFVLDSVAGGTNLEALAEVVKEFNLTRVGIARDDDRGAFARLVGPNVDIVTGAEGLRELASASALVVNAVVGFAGLPVTLATLAAGNRLALANKESLVAAAPLVQQVRASGGDIVPVDSEHCAIHQCLVGATGNGYRDVSRLLLTASGGPFRTLPADQLSSVTLDDALQHPTWSMGPKITVDSSTLMNKGLEVLEASALFGISVDRIDVVIHPQSIIHSMVEFIDGSVLAQLSAPDMRLPIAYCLGLPDRLATEWGRLDFAAGLHLEFSAPRRDDFLALDLAYGAARRGGAAPAWLSAANEVAVAAFLERRIGWRDIVAVVATTLDSYVDVALTSVEELVREDATARRVAHDTLAH
jgi:1-deoxy-D-xylulose-5-phosphate reductoisomerase